MVADFQLDVKVHIRALEEARACHATQLRELQDMQHRQLMEMQNVHQQQLREVSDTHQRQLQDLEAKLSDAVERLKQSKLQEERTSLQQQEVSTLHVESECHHCSV